MSYGAPPGYGYAPPPPPDPSQMGFLDIKIDYMALQWVLTLVTPRIVVDGYEIRKPWGRHMVPLVPGPHHVEVSFPYMFNDHCGRARAVIPIYAACATPAMYESPFFMWSDGKLQVGGPMPMAGPRPY